tara:strand:- start:344 stop:643 length:300 start_codon:yes stop_codon:yes gene_type:complete
MKTIDQMTDEEILKEIRANGKKQGTPEYYMYNLLSTAHPNAIAMMENQALQMKKVGFAMGRDFVEAGNDPDKRAQVMSTLEKISQGLGKTAADDETPDM